MQVIIIPDCTVKEIAALVLAVQERQEAIKREDAKEILKLEKNFEDYLEEKFSKRRRDNFSA